MESTPLIAITGATGNIGKKLAEILLKNGHHVRVIGRSPEKLKTLATDGAEIKSANLENLDQAVDALAGVKAVFAMIPPHYSAPDFRAYQNKVGTALASAIQKNGVTHVVNLSSVGAHLDHGTGPIMGLYDQERLNQIRGLDIVHLRPAYFMENLFLNLSLIRSSGIAGSPLKADLSTPMIATSDIAAVAADYLSHLNFKGVTIRELLGPANVTMQDVTKILGNAVGKKDLPYVQFPYSEAEKAMVGMGLSPDVAQLMVEMNKSMNEGLIKPEKKRGTDTSTPTTVEEFAKTFAAIYKKGG